MSFWNFCGFRVR